MGANPKPRSRLPGHLGALTGLTSSLAAAGIAQWDFNGSLVSSTGGSALTRGSAAPATAPVSSFSMATIGGAPAQVANFGRGTHFVATHGLGANGGGSRLNQFTLLLDLNTPSRPSGWAALYQSNPANADDGEWFINPAGGIGISGNYGGSVPDGTWVRLAAVVDGAAGTLTSFVNGAQVQQVGGPTTDGRWSLGPTFLLFADEDQENAPGSVNSVQLRPWAMTAAEIAALGGPQAGGLPLPEVPTATVTGPNGGESVPAGSRLDITWTSPNASGNALIYLQSDRSEPVLIGQTTLAAGTFPWSVPPWLESAAAYRIELRSPAFGGALDVSDGPFRVTGGVPLNPRFGQPLQANGGFEQQLLAWSITAGHPITPVGGGAKGAAHGGSRFLHGGLNRPGDAVITQEVDLAEAGFSAADLDGAELDGEAWLRNWFGAGNFDDQVFWRVSFLDHAARELSAVRCLVAADSVWLQRPLNAVLPPGTRRLRIEVIGRHRRDADNDSMADDFAVRLRRPWPPVTTPPEITKLPMLQDVRPDAMTLLWETDHNHALHAVEWGRSAVTEQTQAVVETLQIDATHFVHRATLTDLERETAYTYRVRSSATVSPEFTFRTAPGRDTPVVAAWWGDNHGGTATLRGHVANLLRHSPDLICVAGDMVNSGNSLSEWHNYWFKPLEHLQAAQTRPVIFARGNHDSEHALAYAYSALPGNESWFAFDYGNSRFIFLDSEADGTVSPEQLAWLRTELNRPETQQAAFRIVCFHKPPWSQFWNGGGHTQEPFVIAEWVPLFRTLGVDLVICGHEHAYHRGLRDGVTYVVSGGGGGTIDTQRVADWSHVQVEFNRFHYDIMTIEGPRLSWETYDDGNQLLDEFTLVSRVPRLSLPSAGRDAGSLAVVLTGRSLSQHVLEGSTDLIQWSPVVTNTVPADGTPVTNSIALDPGLRLLRARPLP